ncbi:MAG: CBS domain-containing protein [Planctomycetales bacterium]|nr:CBS domain-containing protein [Planctomycetales bacterium]
MTGSAILAREIMTQNLITLSPDLDVFEAIELLLRRRISGAPVVESNGSYLGVFSESSCMRFIVNAAYDAMPDAGLMPFVDGDAPTIEPDTDVLTIVQTFLNQGTRRLPVLDAGRLVGQVSRRDVMRTVVELTRDKKCGHAELLYLSALQESRERVAGRLG